MLVLSRQRDETIMIGDEIEITVVDIRGDKIRLGITAPARIAVHRKEVHDAIRQENAIAATLEGEAIDSIAQTVRPGLPKKGIAKGLVHPPAATTTTVSQDEGVEGRQELRPSA